LLTQYLDRYLLKFFFVEALVGVYTFYCTTANIVQVFVYTGIIMTVYPRIIQAYQQNRLNEYTLLMKKLFIHTVSGATGIAIVATVSVTIFLHVVDKSLYQQYIAVYWILLISTIINVVAQVPHYALYAKKKDKSILVSSLVALVVSLTMNLILTPKYGLIGAAFSNLASMLSLIIVKIIYVYK